MTHGIKFATLALSLLLLPAAQAQERKDQADAAERAEIEAQLKSARTRLEAAARQVAELSGKLTGPVAYDYIVANRLYPRGAILGITIDEDTDSGKGGVAVQSVVPDGPADEAGIKSGDLIISLDGKSLKDGKPSPGRALIDRMQEVKPGEKVKVELLRNGKKQTVEVTTEAAGLAMFGLGEAGKPFVMYGQRQQLPRVKEFQQPPPMPNVVTSFNHFLGAEMLDMELVTVTPKLGKYFGADHGVLVIRPPRDSDLKLEEGDVILDIDGRQPQSGVHAMRILRSYQPGEEVTFNVMRDRKTLKVAVTMPKAGRGWDVEPRVRSFRIPAEPPQDNAT